MKIFNLGNGHTLEVQKANRGIEDDYKVTFKEDGKALFTSRTYFVKTAQKSRVCNYTYSTIIIHI